MYIKPYTLLVSNRALYMYLLGQGWARPRVYYMKQDINTIHNLYRCLDDMYTCVLPHMAHLGSSMRLSQNSLFCVINNICV